MLLFMDIVELFQGPQVSGSASFARDRGAQKTARIRNVLHPCSVFYRLVEYLFDYFDKSNLAGFDFQIIYCSQSWLANETKQFDDNPVSL